MEKILLAIDPVNLDMPAVDFACFIAQLTHSKLTGIFLENLVAAEKPVLNQVYSSGAAIGGSAQYSTEKRELIEKNIQFLKQACENRSTRCNIHRDRGIPAKELITESRYADLIIVDAATSFSKSYEGMPSDFVRDILEDAECPVIVAPQAFEGIDEIIFTYDNSPSSAFAIKQFTYLLPQLDDRKVTIVQVNKEGVWADPDKYNLREWLQNRYSAIGFEALKGETTDKLFDYLFQRKNAFIVMGAYGRSGLSRYFKHSHADILIKTLVQPIFITHY